MKYTISRAFSWLLWHKGAYAILCVELLVGVCMFILAANSIMTASEEMAKVKAEVQDKEIVVTPILLNWDFFADDVLFEINYNDYVQVSDGLDDVMRINYRGIVDSTVFNLQDDTAWSFKLHFINENMFEDTFGFKQEQGIVYADEAAIANIQILCELDKDKYKVENKALQFADDKIFINGIGYSLKKLQNNDVKIFTNNSIQGDNENDTGLENCIFFPVEVMTTFTEDDMAFYVYKLTLIEDGVTNYYEFEEGLKRFSGSSSMSMRYITTDFEQDVVATIIDKLNRNHSGMYRFEVGGKAIMAEESINQAVADMQMVMFVSCFVLVIIVLTVIGILMIFLNKRRRSIAISLAVGSSFGTTAAELLTEILTVCIIGSGLGIVASYFIMPYVTTFYLEYTYHLESSIVIGIVIAIAIAVLASSLALSNIRNFKPAEILRDN